MGTSNFGEYIIFVDESGDHGLTSINPENPVFLLVFCVFKKVDYVSIVKPALSNLKFKFWGHDLAVLHNYEIRKSIGDFSFLFNEELRHVFINGLNETIKRIPFSIIATAIDKRHLKIRDQNPENPYVLALDFCLKQAYQFIAKEKQLQHLTHVIIESRGKPKDKDLEAAFRKISIQSDLAGTTYPFDIRFANKMVNSAGLQIADLVAYPIARHIINEKQPNRAFEIAKEKLLGYPEYEEIGLKLYPPKNEMPRDLPRQIADRELPIHLK